MLILTDKNFEEEILQSKTPVLVDFWASYCGPCVMMGSIIEEIAKEFEGKVKVGKLNIEENRSITSKYNIESIPTLILFKEGKVIEAYIGLRSKDFLKEKLNSILR